MSNKQSAPQLKYKSTVKVKIWWEDFNEWVTKHFKLSKPFDLCDHFNYVFEEDSVFDKDNFTKPLTKEEAKILLKFQQKKLPKYFLTEDGDEVVITLLKYMIAEHIIPNGEVKIDMG